MTMIDALPAGEPGALADDKPSKTAKAKKPTEAERFEFMGEFLDLDPKVGYPLRALMIERAAALTKAKEAAFEIEDQIKELMQGYENLRLNGEVIATWKWCDATEFDKKAFGEKHPKLLAKFTNKVKNKTRRFNFKGVVGVD